MCLEVRDTNKIKATSDIICYKLVVENNNVYETFFQNTKVEIGSTYYSDLVLGVNGVYIGLHSVLTIEEAAAIVWSYSRCFTYESESEISIVKCVIPESCNYYHGKFEGLNSYASDGITYLEIVKTYNMDDIKEINEIKNKE